MKLYMRVLNKKIVSVNTEKQENCPYEVEAENLDDFYSQISEIGDMDEDAEDYVRDAFDESEDKSSVETYNIKHWVSNRSFGELIDMYTNGEIIKPDMQREFVWDAQKSSRLIESIILGLPIPPLFLLEVGNNEYELIDGYQRLTTVTNYVSEVPWNGKNEKRNSPAKLSGKISQELIGKKFSALSVEHQRMIKRSTIPLIEFKQIGPDDYSSKYLIFERINTGSEKLNEMQIRKSLVHGAFISSIYNIANNCETLKSLFSVSSIKKDAHVEAALRIYVMSEIVYRNYKCDKTGINNILNEFCEKNKNNAIPSEYGEKLERALTLLLSVFGGDKVFRRVEKDKDGNYRYLGNMNISILEAMVGVAIEKNLSDSSNLKTLKDRYNDIMFEVTQKSIRKEEDNPFSTSTGARSSIINRFDICEKIME